MKYIVDVFTYNKKGGNKAGVVILDKELTRNQYQNIAKEFGFSETVFIKKISNKIFKLRFYTPECEIEFCGHASLAAFHILNKVGIIEEGKYIERLNFRDLEVIVEEKKIFLEQDNVKIEVVSEIDEILDSIGLNSRDLYEGLEVVMGYTGLRDILIPIRNKQILNNLNINFKKVKDISERYSVVGYHVYTLDNNEIYCRNFAPLYGINEEAATGSSNGALFGYLNTIDNYKNNFMNFFQGENYGEISKIIVKYINNKIYIGSEF